MDQASLDHLELSSSRYESVADTFKLAAETQFGLSISDQTYDLWKHTMKAARRLDILLDEEDGTDFINRERTYLQAVSHIEGKEDSFSSGNPDLDDSVQSLQIRTADLSESSRTFFADTLRNILRVTKQIKVAESADELTRLTRLEGQLAAHLLSASLNKNGDDPSKQRDFGRWLSRVGRFANAFDTAVDLPKDYGASETKVKPTFLNRARLLWGARADLIEITPKLRMPLIVSLGKRAIETAKGRNYTYKDYGQSREKGQPIPNLHFILDGPLTEEVSFDALMREETPCEYMTKALAVRQIIDGAHEVGAETIIHYPDGSEQMINDALTKRNI